MFFILLRSSASSLLLCYYKTWSRKSNLGFPVGAVVENLPANAGDMGSSPGLGRSHMPRSNWAREPQLLSEPACLELVLRNKRGRNSERPAHRDEEWPPLAATGESPHTETKTQHSNQSINQSVLFFSIIYTVTFYFQHFSSTGLTSENKNA